MDVCVGDSKLIGRKIRRSLKQAASSRPIYVAEVAGLMAEKNLVRTWLRIRTKTDTGRRGEYPQALERILVKELGKLTP